MESSKKDDQSSSNNLPREVLFAMFLHLSPADIFSAALVNKEFNEILKDNVFWKMKFEQDFPLTYKRLNKRKNKEFFWYEEFRKRYFRNNKNKLREANKRGHENEFREVYRLVEKRDGAGIKKMNKLAESGYDNIKDDIVKEAQLLKNQTILDFLYESEIKKDVNDTFRWAIQCHQSEEILNSLIERGANIHSKDIVSKAILLPFSVEYAMQDAVLSGYLDTVKFLLTKGIAITIANESLLLRLATKENHFEIVNFLLDQGVDVNNAFFSDTALNVAADRGHIDIIELLLERGAKIEPEPPRKEIDLPLFTAARNGDTEIVNIFLDEGAQVDYKTAKGKTPLYCASLNGHANTVRLLLEHGANVNNRQNDGGTPLMAAAQAGHAEVAKVLLEHHANINHHCAGSRPRGYTPLSLAVMRGHTKVAQVLLEGGANVEERDKLALVKLLLTAKIYGSIVRALEKGQFAKMGLSIFMPHKEKILQAFIKQLEKDPENKIMRLDNAIAGSNELGVLFATPTNKGMFSLTMRRDETGKKMTKSMGILLQLRNESGKEEDAGMKWKKGFTRKK